MQEDQVINARSLPCLVNALVALGVLTSGL